MALVSLLVYQCFFRLSSIQFPWHLAIPTIIKSLFLKILFTFIYLMEAYSVKPMGNNIIFLFLTKSNLEDSIFW